jgi:hypothetical protein
MGDDRPVILITVGIYLKLSKYQARTSFSRRSGARALARLFADRAAAVVFDDAGAEGIVGGAGPQPRGRVRRRVGRRGLGKDDARRIGRLLAELRRPVRSL